MSRKTLFEVTTYFSLDEYGLKFYPFGSFYVAHAPKTPVNCVRLYRLGLRLTFCYLLLKNLGFSFSPDLQRSTVASLDEVLKLEGVLKCP